MRTIIQQAFQAAQSGSRSRMPRVRTKLPLALLALSAILLGDQNLFAARAVPQTPPPSQAATPKKKLPRRAKRTSRTKHPAVPAQAAAAPAPPPEPKPPNWPVNDQPGKPMVVWDSHGLRIEAKNSSLRQIMQDVATATGIKVEGMGTDERVFGVYGPGKARDVLSQLLDGTDYNVLMIGGAGDGTPREIVLSAQTKGSPSQAPADSQAANEANSAVEKQPAEEPPPPPPALHPGYGPGVPARTPQQIMKEMQERQQQLQQQIQQRNNSQH